MKIKKLKKKIKFQNSNKKFNFIDKVCLKMLLVFIFIFKLL